MSRLIPAGLSLLLASSVFAESDLRQKAQGELFAARYAQAAELYRQAIAQDASQGDAYYGLVRALLRLHRASDAYDAADLALKNAPRTPGALTAAGMAEYRRGDLLKSQNNYVAALKIDPKYPGALAGLSLLNTAASKFKTARGLLLAAYQGAPDDPGLALVHADTLKGVAHIEELKRILAIYDPESLEARGLRAHIAADMAVGDRKLRRMISPNRPARVKMIRLIDGPSRRRGVGLRVELNGKETVTLLLDTGASGVSLSPKAAARAGLELLSGESTRVNGIGDDRTPDAFAYVASEVRVGDVAFADYPISVFRTAKSSDFEGLIGADVFQRFLVTIDFPKLELELAPRSTPLSGELEDAGPPPAGFTRAIRVGNHLALFTAINSHPGRLFLMDSGSNINLIDTAAAKDAATLGGDASVTLKGVQGTVKKTALAERVTITFAGLRQENPAMVAINMDPTNDAMGLGLAGILGIPVLDQLRVTIDYRSGAVRMEYRK